MKCFVLPGLCRCRSQERPAPMLPRVRTHPPPPFSLAVPRLSQRRPNWSKLQSNIIQPFHIKVNTRSNCQFSRTWCQFVLNYHAHARHRTHVDPEWKDSPHWAKSTVWRKRKKKKKSNPSRVYLNMAKPPSSGLEGWKGLCPHLALGSLCITLYLPSSPSCSKLETDSARCHVPQFQCVCFVWSGIHRFLIHLHLNHQDVIQGCLCGSQRACSSSLLIWKKKNHTLWSVDLKPQICTAKKKTGTCCFLSFGFPSLKDGVANWQTQLNRRICTNRVGSSTHLLCILSS